MRYPRWIIFVTFLIIVVGVLSRIIFNDLLIGQFMDYPIPPIKELLANVYFQDFQTWRSVSNGGSNNSFSSALIPINTVLFWPVIFKVGPWMLERYQLILTLVVAMFSFYLLACRLMGKNKCQEKHYIALVVLAGVFFTLNNYFFSELNFGSNVMYLTLAFIPLALYFAISYLETQKDSYFILTLLALIIVSSTLQHLILIYVVITLLAVIYKKYFFSIKIGMLHFLLSLYWILPMLSTINNIQQNELSGDYSSSLVVSASQFFMAFANAEYFGNRDMYRTAMHNQTLSNLWIINSYFLLGCVVLASLYYQKLLTPQKRRLVINFLILFIFSLLFIKGAREPLSDIVLFLYDRFTILNIFRSVQRYISFYVVSLSILFVYAGMYWLSISKKAIYALGFLVIINAMPWWLTWDLGMKNIAENEKYSAFNQFRLSEGERKFYQLNNLPLQFSLLTMPPGASVYFEASNHQKYRSQGTDAGLVFGNKKYFAAEGARTDMKKIINYLEREMYRNQNFINENEKILSLLGIRYLVLRDNITPVFSDNARLFNYDNIVIAIEKASNITLKEIKNPIKIYTFKDFLPVVYTPSQIVATSRTIENALELTKEADYKNDAALVLESQNDANWSKLLTLSKDGLQIKPTVEFKKINDTKYRVILHQVTQERSIILGESFDKGWKVYAADISEKTKDANLKLDNISSAEDAASREELNEFITMGLVSSLKNDYDSKNGFISKNFYGTIQNNNLNNGKFYETWFEKPLDEGDHFKANGYANGWIINPESICQLQNSSCREYSDGSRDIELVITYWPQRMLYLGGIVSGITFLGIIIYYIYKKRNKFVKEYFKQKK